MIISEAAQYLTHVTGETITSKKLIAELQKKFPTSNFKDSSEVPEAFVEEIEKIAAAKSHQSAQEPSGKIQKADPKNTLEAIKDSHQSGDLIVSCIYEALADEKIAYVVQQAINDSLKLLNVYESTQEQILEKAVSSRILDLQNSTSDLIAEREQDMVNYAIARGERLGKLTRQKATSSKSRADSQAYLDQILDVI